MYDELRHLLQRSEELWQFGVVPPGKGVRGRLVRWLTLRALGPVIAQQREFNAVVVKMIYQLTAVADQLTEVADQRYSNSLAQIGQIEGALQTSSRQLTELQQHIGDVDVHLGDIDQLQLAIARQLGDLEHGRGEER